MPIYHNERGWWWGSKGPFKTRVEAEKVAAAVYATGWRETNKDIAGVLKKISY
jgi:hypothetical protein